MRKKLCLSDNKKITGVCGGIAESFDLEPTIVRLIAILLLLLFKLPVLFLYVLLWIIMPGSGS